MNEPKTIDRAEDTGCCGTATCSANLVAEKLWDAINKITLTDEWEVEDRYSERPYRCRQDHYVKDQKDRCILAMVAILEVNLPNANPSYGSRR